ncbi:MAG: PIN domain-containing protein [Thermoanaerobaculia bacterium]
MRSLVLDTNVLLSFLTDRDPSQQQLAEKLFEAAARGELRLIVPQIVLVELTFVLRNLYQRSVEEIAETLSKALALPGVEPADPTAWALVLELWPRVVDGLPDALIAAVAKLGRHDGVATFDRRLARVLSTIGVESHW